MAPGPTSTRLSGIGPKQAVTNREKKLKSTGWKDVAELIGIVAIVASLIAVMLELQQTQAAISAATYQARAFDGIAGARERYSGDYIAPILSQIDLNDPDTFNDLTEEEKVRLRAFLLEQMIDFDNEYYQYQQGFLDDEYYEYWFKDRLPSVARLWRSVGIVERRPSFREFVDDALR